MTIRRAPVQLLLNGEKGSAAGIVQSYAARILSEYSRELGGGGIVDVRTRAWYNPAQNYKHYMVPGILVQLVTLVGTLMTALNIVREKELGSIVNFYVTPTTRLEFLLGKQFPYVVLSMLSFLLLTLLAVTVFGVPMKGSFLALSVAALLYVISATAMGLLFSTFVRSQIAAIFGTAILTLLPAVQFCGMTSPVSALEGLGRLIGNVYPTTYFLTIARGTFSKALGFADLQASFLPLILAVPLLTGLCVLLLRKQER